MPQVNDGPCQQAPTLRTSRRAARLYRWRPASTSGRCSAGHGLDGDSAHVRGVDGLPSLLGTGQRRGATVLGVCADSSCGLLGSPSKSGRRETRCGKPPPTTMGNQRGRRFRFGIGTSGTVQGCSMVPRSGSRAGVLPRAVPRLAFPRLSMAMCSAWTRWRQRPCATEQAAARRGGRASIERMGRHVVGGVGNTRQARRRVHPSGAVGPIGLKASGPPPFRLWLQGGVFAMSWHRWGWQRA